MSVGVYVGIILIFCGLIYIFLRRSQSSESETNIKVSNFELKGGPGSILIVLGVLLIVLESFFLPAPPNSDSTEVTQPEVTSRAPSAEIKNVWVDYDVWEDDLFGMRIHTSFNAYNLKGEYCEISSYFYFDSGESLKDFNQEYRDTDGNIAASEYFTPDYVDATYSDVPIFLPYEELHMSPGSYNLTFNVAIWHDQEKLAESEWIYFNYTQPEA